MPIGKREATGGALVLAVAGVLALRWLWARPVSPDVIAERCLESAMAGEPDGLLRYEHPHELDLVKWDRVKLKAILDFTNGTILRGMRPSAPIQRQYYGPHQGVAYAKFSVGPYVADLSMSAEASDEGPKTCISAYVLSAISARTKLDGRSGAGTDWRVHRVAMSETMAKYMGKLKELGLPGYVTQDPNNPHITRWETWVKYKGGVTIANDSEKATLK